MKLRQSLRQVDEFPSADGAAIEQRRELLRCLELLHSHRIFDDRALAGDAQASRIPCNATTSTYRSAAKRRFSRSSSSHRKRRFARVCCRGIPIGRTF